MIEKLAGFEISFNVSAIMIVKLYLFLVLSVDTSFYYLKSLTAKNSCFIDFHF